ncbi:MAG: hypothetical protein Q7K57_26390 [Burkholderiaceae bacterium]|nr:hypothetical protein [Burkholderiaceae bacterium]
MNSIKRTCATCAAFNPSATEDGDACGNLTFFTEQHGTPQEWHREPGPTDYCDSHQTHEEDAAQTQEIEVARQFAESTPEFLTAMSACLALVESLGIEHPDTTRALQRAMALAPPSMHDFVAAQAHELDLIPEADGYTEDGEPVFSLESIAVKFDISMDEAHAAMDAMLEDRAPLDLPAPLVDPATVHRKH